MINQDQVRQERDKLKALCIKQQHELNKLRSQVKRIRKITKE